MLPPAARKHSGNRHQDLIVIVLPGPSKPNSGASTSRATATQPSVPEKSGRATCRKIALPLPGTTGAVL